MTDDLGPLPKVHPRSEVVYQAEMELKGFLVKLREDYNLTRAEYLSLLACEVTDDLRRAVLTERKQAHDP